MHYSSRQEKNDSEGDSVIDHQSCPSVSVGGHCLDFSRPDRGYAEPFGGSAAGEGGPTIPDSMNTAGKTTREWARRQTFEPKRIVREP